MASIKEWLQNMNKACREPEKKNLDFLSGLNENHDSKGEPHNRRGTAEVGSSFRCPPKGAIVEFGRFSQEGKHAEPTPIRWIVLDVKGNEAFVLSQYALDEESYDERTQADLSRGSQITKTTWETSSIRKKLNGEFYERAFSEDEKKAIMITRVSNGPEECTSDQVDFGGNDTNDKIFLLSFNEVEKHLGKYAGSPLRIAKQTKYCRAWGNEYDSLWRDLWWLRSPAENGRGALVVQQDGKYAYEYVERFEVAIRPAMWIDLTNKTVRVTEEIISNGPDAKAIHEAVFSVGAARLNAAIQRSGVQVNYEADNGNGFVHVCFIDLPLQIGSQCVCLLAWAIFEDKYGNQLEFKGLVRPTIEAEECVIVSSKPPYLGGEEDYKLFSSAALAYACENGFPKGFSRHQLHPAYKI